MKKLFTFLFIVLSTAVFAQDLVINEFLSDPYHQSIEPVESWDANDDGSHDSDDDEFIELVNNSGHVLDISGYVIHDNYTAAHPPKTRHTFAENTILDPGESIVVFGAGLPSLSIPGQAVVAGYGSLGLNNDGDKITILDADGVEVTSYEYVYGEAVDQAWARNPDITGAFGLHTDANTGVYYSPGKDNTDDTPFPETAITGTLIINEFLADPRSDDTTTTQIEGDANGDGIRDYSQDEFIEIYNNSGADIDISGYTISDLKDKGTVRHKFAAGTTLPNGEAIVVFGGGTPTGIPCTALTASSGKFSLDNSGDRITLKNTSGNVVARYAYTSADGADNQSLAREPDFTGSFVKHLTIATNAVDYSPGRDNTDNTPLPVELTTFTANVIDAGVELNWTTATEVNNFGFEIERTSEGTVAWTKIGFVEGHGNSNSPKEYSFLDNSVNGTVSYRLKQIDIDGNYEYSKVVEAVATLPVEYNLSQNYPNPFNPTTQITYSIPKSSNVVLKVFNAIGAEVATLVNKQQEIGKYSVVFNASKLTSGVYYYTIKADNYTSVKKLMLLK